MKKAEVITICVSLLVVGVVLLVLKFSVAKESHLQTKTLRSQDTAEERPAPAKTERLISEESATQAAPTVEDSANNNFVSSPLVEGKEAPPGVVEGYWEQMKQTIPDEVERNQYWGRMYYLGRKSEYMNCEKDYRVARTFFLKAAAMGDARSMRHLGHIYSTGGHGVLSDDKEAAKWYRSAATKGDVPAAALLGMIYRMGRGVPENVKESNKWTLKAAMGGDEKAQFLLGQIHCSGSGVLADSITGYAWFNIAAANGHSDAEKAKKELRVNELTREQIAKGQDLAKQMVKANPGLLK